MSRTVDRGLARLIALKRIMTGTTALIAGVVTVVVTVMRGEAPPMMFLAVAIFLGGGVWTLRDGLRLKRELEGR